jgi:hypothetical protein
MTLEKPVCAFCGTANPKAGFIETTVFVANAISEGRRRVVLREKYMVCRGTACDARLHLAKGGAGRRSALLGIVAFPVLAAYGAQWAIKRAWKVVRR